jgi:hypothetical protein
MDQNNLFGMWELVSLEAIKKNGDAHTGWLGEKPTGILVYDRSGRMSVQIMSGPRDSKDKPESFFGYYAYFGTLEVNQEKQTIIHHVEGSIRSDEIGVDYEQDFTVTETQLVLLTPPHVVFGEERRNRIVWKRSGSK